MHDDGLANADDDFAITFRAATEWHEHEERLRRKNRVVVSDEPYFRGLLEECVSRLTEWASPRTLFRARLMPPDQNDVPFGLDSIGAPPATGGSGGRLNPPGIPCLYAALDVETAIAEVRPWISARLTVGSLETVGSVKIIDLSDLGSIDPALRKAAFAAYMMQRPTHRDDDVAYVATQHLAEHLKARGADGIAYGSSLRRRGINVALFQPDLAKPVATSLWEVSDVIYNSYDLTGLIGNVGPVRRNPDSMRNGTG